MPQMAPMSWVLLFVFFTITLLFFNSMNYYLFIQKTPDSKTSSSMSKTNMTWKW